jgi:transcriptional regulator of acetoin/glycerol metabolism
MCLNDQTILTNSAAARLLGAVDKALLWEQASRAINERAEGVSTLVLSDGRRILAHCHPIYDGLTPVGAKIEIELDGEYAAKSARRRPAAPAGESLTGLAGQSVRWQTFCEDALAAKNEDSPLLLVGEPGTGKLAAVHALFDGDQVDVFDVALQGIEPTKWLKGLSKRLDNPEGVVVLQHLETLQECMARTVASMIAGAFPDGPRIVGTLSGGDGSAMDQFDRVVKVPPLRDRLDDMRELVQALSDRHASKGAKWQWMPDAIQTLSRVDWSANVRSLQSVVKQVVAGRPGAYVDARGLPEAVRAAASRRPLSRLEQLEAAAITEALQQSRGNKLEAAHGLGIARSTLYRRMRALGIDLTEANY